jgi:uncharacterized membrane protein YqjE
MRTLRLAGVAAQAERLRLRRLARRMAIRAALGGVAAVFVLLALAGVHVVVVIQLADRMPVEHAVLWVVAGDMVLALLFAWLALRMSRPGPSEREARLLRDEALLPLCDLISVGRVALRVERLWLRAALLLLQFLSGGRAK